MIEATDAALAEGEPHATPTSTYVIPHQANRRIIDAAAKHLDLPADKRRRSPSTATATRAPPRFRSRCPRRYEAGRLKDGDMIVFVGFGGGLSWGAVAWRWVERDAHRRRLSRTGLAGVGMGADVARAYPAAAAALPRGQARCWATTCSRCAPTGPKSSCARRATASRRSSSTNVALARAVGDVLAPVVSAGHSFGEYCSLTIAGALTLRGRARARQPARARDARAAAQLARGGDGGGAGARRRAAARRGRRPRSRAAPAACSSRTSTNPGKS